MSCPIFVRTRLQWVNEVPTSRSVGSLGLRPNHLTRPLLLLRAVGEAAVWPQALVLPGIFWPLRSAQRSEARVPSPVSPLQRCPELKHESDEAMGGLTLIVAWGPDLGLGAPTQKSI